MSNRTPGPWTPQWRRAPRWHSESPANTRLIAAAPDLLEALETALDTLREIRVSRQSDADSVSDTIGLIEAAIAKAVVS